MALATLSKSVSERKLNYIPYKINNLVNCCIWGTCQKNQKRVILNHYDYEHSRKRLYLWLGRGSDS